MDSHHLLSTHLLGPLFMEYESMIRMYERDLKNKTMEVQTQGDEIKFLVKENDELLQRLDIQQREYLKLVEETRDNADLLAIKTGSMKYNNMNSSALGIDEVRELKERCHLLTDENQVLFEQVTQLRAYYDKYNEEVTSKLSEAEYKSQAYDMLQAEFENIAKERENILRDRQFFESKFLETS